MKTIRNIIIGAGVVLALGSCTESFSDRCRREAKEYTERECPRLEHQFVILDSMTYEDAPEGFTYHYRLTGDFDDTNILTPEVLHDFSEEIRLGLRQNIKLKAYKERGFTFTYRYLSDRNDSLLLEASFGPEDYN